MFKAKLGIEGLPCKAGTEDLGDYSAQPDLDVLYYTFSEKIDQERHTIIKIKSRDPLDH